MYRRNSSHARRIEIAAVHGQLQAHLSDGRVTRLKYQGGVTFVLEINEYSAYRFTIAADRATALDVLKDGVVASRFTRVP